MLYLLLHFVQSISLSIIQFYSRQTHLLLSHFRMSSTTNVKLYYDVTTKCRHGFQDGATKMKCLLSSGRRDKIQPTNCVMYVYVYSTIRLPSGRIYQKCVPCTCDISSAHNSCITQSVWPNEHSCKCCLSL